MAFSATFLKRLPISTSLLYLCIGVVLGPYGFALIRGDVLELSQVLERATEVVVIVSLFTAGLKMRLSFSDKRWLIPLRLAFVSMALTVGLITAIGVWGVGLPLGAAVLLGAILAPTDPVLASEVQVDEPGDADRVRLGLTGEAGFNDGTAFPFVMLGLGLLGLHDLGTGGWRWVAIDVLWGVIGGLGIGWLSGCLVGRLIIFLRLRHEETVELDDFVALGLILLSYGIALACHAYGFLAVFAAALALRRMEHKTSEPEKDEEANSTQEKPAKKSSPPLDADNEKPGHVPQQMTQQVLSFNEQVEHILELGMVLLLGGLLTTRYLPIEALWFVPLLFLVVRPLAVWLGLARSRTSRRQRSMMMWFGIRGIGSIYYLMYAIEHGLPHELAEKLTAFTLATVAASIVIHGISATPLMKRYQKSA